MNNNIYVSKQTDTNNELYHWGFGKRAKHKYIARVKTKKGKYRYFYTREEYQRFLKGKDSKLDLSDVDPKELERLKAQNPSLNIDSDTNPQASSQDKTVLGKALSDDLVNGVKKTTKENVKQATKTGESFVDRIFNKIAGKAEKLPDHINKVVDKVVDFGNKIYDDKDNIYDVNPHNYKKKVAKIKQTKEWKDIVKRKDPEYVRKTKDGKTVYLIDDYIVKKKNPILDVLDDITSNRKVTINKISKDATVAGIKASAFGTLAVGMMGVKAVTKLMTEKSKLYQGSYESERKEIKKRMKKGMQYVDQMTDTAGSFTSDDIDNVLNVIDNTTRAVKKTTQNEFDMNKVTKAAKMLSSGGSADAYAEAASVLPSLSEEEAQYLGYLLSKRYNV